MYSKASLLFAAISALSAIERASAAVHTISVGKGGFIFTPNSITAAVGDQVEFEWESSGHSVTEGAFANPCQPASATSFNSGFLDSGDWVIKINSTDPIYFYCATSGHCQAGMAGAINAPSTHSAEDWIDASKKTSGSKTQSQVQGGTFGAPKASPSSSTSAPSSSASSSASSAPSSSASSKPTSTPTSAPTSGTIASIPAISIWGLIAVLASVASGACL